MIDSNTNPRILITGGSGFLGRAVLGELASNDAVFTPASVRLFDKRPLAPDLADIDLPLEFVKGDIRNLDEIESACAKVDIVIHMASMVDWGTHPRAEVFALNVDGTKNVIAACAKQGVKVLVYTSSLDAIFAGKAIVDADETHPYPARFHGAYSETKALAEQLVQDANRESLKTVALRPSSIYGEADPFHIEALVKMARSGPFIKIGNGRSRSMHIYVGNVAHAHLLAARELYQGNQTPAGEVYFLVDSEPENFFDHFCPILEKGGVKIRPRNLRVPAWLLYPVALAADGIAFLTRGIDSINPTLSRFALSYLDNDFTLVGDKARRDFGFVPKYSPEEAKERTAEWIRRMNA